MIPDTFKKKSKFPIVISLLVLAATATALLTLSFAADGGDVAFEAEWAPIQGGAQLVNNDSSASGRR